ncbi:hypothetical protein [Falsibacillus albus]|uniref:Uncharacterized protein n=1 Tax=Falsibacillus albus TaxID=2478915 RepID=A0A3L7JVC9_9BACI|nr:hypothetical protein [Falsibacillus albus]RLQ92392.1 hypothetical protein D9X91_19270 [Falsibacillus albus]
MAKSMKRRASLWVYDQISGSYIDSEKDSLKRHYLHFKLEGFCDEPEIYLVANEEGLEWGYTVFKWDNMGVPLPMKKALHFLAWKDLNVLSAEEKIDKIIEEMMKAVNAKKREYRKCKKCENKLHDSQFYNKTHCRKCAKKHLGVYVD